MSKKAFVSYARTNDEHMRRIVEISTLLMKDHGIEVLLDVWDCKEGDDLHYYMERMVNDDSVDYVLIFSDSNYCNKANGREGGVGTESTIITSQIYDKQNDSKFIPIFFELLKEGKPSLPTFCTTRYAIDMTNEDLDIEKAEEIGRRINDKPKFAKPKLGKVPDYDNEDFDLKKVFKKLENSKDYNERKNFEEALNTIYDFLIDFEKDGNEYNQEELLKMKTILEYWKQIIEYAISKEKFYFRELIIEHYNKCLKDVENDYKNPMIKIFNYFSFLLLVKELLTYDDSEFLKDILFQKYTYLRKEYHFNILSSYPHNLVISSNYNIENLKKHLLTLYFDEKEIPKIEETDVILYTASLFIIPGSNMYNVWHGSLLYEKWPIKLMDRNNTLVNRFKNKEIFERYSFLFDGSKDSLIDKIEHNNSLDNLPTILNLVNKNELCSY